MPAQEPCKNCVLVSLITPGRFNKWLNTAKEKLAGIEFDAIAVVGNCGEFFGGAVFGGALAAALGKPIILLWKNGAQGFKVECDDYKTYIFVDGVLDEGAATFHFALDAMKYGYPSAQYVGRYMYLMEFFVPPAVDYYYRRYSQGAF